MEIKQLRWYITLAEEKNFTRAAEQLYISQPYLSQKMAELELELGVALLDRSRRGVGLTKNGELMLREAREIISRVDGLPVLFAEARASRDMHNSIEIGLDETELCLERFGIPQSIAALQEEYPGLHMHVTTGSCEKMQSMLISGLLDVAFITLGEDDRVSGRLEQRQLADDRFVLVLPDRMAREGMTAAEAFERAELFMDNAHTRWIACFNRIFDELNVCPRLHFSEFSDYRPVLLKKRQGTSAGAYITLSGILDYYADKGVCAIPLDAPHSRVRTAAVWKTGSRNAWVERLMDYMEK